MTLFERRALTTFVASTLALGVSTLSAQAKDTPAHSAARGAIESAYARCAKASLKNDVPAAMSIFTPDFHLIGLDGSQLDFGQYQAVLQNKMTLRGLQYDSVKSTIQKTEWRGEDVAVWAYISTHTSYKGNRISVVAHERDYWRHTPHGWMISQTVALDASTWVNGKLVGKTA